MQHELSYEWPHSELEESTHKHNQNALNRPLIMGMLVSSEPEFIAGSSAGKTRFKHSCTSSLNPESVFQYVLYGFPQYSALWRFGYLWGWDEEFYKYSMLKREEQANAPKLVRDERGER